MIVQKLGGFCFKLSAGPVTVAINPPAPKSKYKVNKFGSDIVLVSGRHSDFEGVETATHGEKEPFLAIGPGDYEVGDVTISGFATPTEYEGPLMEYGNTAYLIDMDGIRVLALGALSTPKLPAELREEIDNIGILLLPIGEGALSPKDAHELVVAMEPHIVIPYGMHGDADVSAYLKVSGEKGVDIGEKLTVRAKEVLEKDGEVVLLK